jgi:hypothetical protein
MKIGVMFGNPETTTGGNALKFYASVRLDIRQHRLAQEGRRDHTAAASKVKVVKNKVAPPFTAGLLRHPLRHRGSRAKAKSSSSVLRQRGVADNIIEAVLSDNRDSELERAQAVWQKKFGSAPTDVTEKARQMRFLQSRGFGAEVIRRVIHDAADA